MSYEPTNWKAGDVVTSAKLNKLENGVANGGGILAINVQNSTLDKTYQEIEDAFANKMPCAVFSQSEEGLICDFVTIIGSAENMYNVGIYKTQLQRMVVYAADTKDGYPVTGK